MLGHRLSRNSVLKTNGKGQSSKIRKGIVQEYTARVQQIGRTLKGQGEKEEREEGAKAS